MSALLTPALVDILLFEVAGRIWGADAGQVLRIDRPGDDTVSVSELGPIAGRGRALVFATEAGQGELKVDGVHGVKAVPEKALRRLPAVATHRPYAIGEWLDGENPIVLVDLVEMLNFQKGR